MCVPSLAPRCFLESRPACCSAGIYGLRHKRANAKLVLLQRLGEAEGLATFTALQRQGVPSELLYFPTENHWVLNPCGTPRCSFGADCAYERELKVRRCVQAELDRVARPRAGLAGALAAAGAG